MIVSAHGNSLRALVKHLSGISDAEITGLEIPTGQPIVYELDDNLNALSSAITSGGALKGAWASDPLSPSSWAASPTGRR